MASLHRHGKAWRVHWRERGRQRTKTFPTKVAAAGFKRQVESELAAPVTGPAMTMADLLDAYLERRQTRVDHAAEYAPRVRAEAETVLSLHPHWRRPTDITADEMGRLKQGHFRLIKAMLGVAVRLGVPIAPGVLAVRYRSQGKRPKPPLLTPEQVAEAQRIADRWGPGEGLAVHLVATYGHRPDSIARLTIADVDLATGHLTLDLKSGDSHRHPILSPTLERLRAACAGRSPGSRILISHQGKPYASGQHLSQWYFHQVGTWAHPHDRGMYALKRYAITTMFDRGLDAVTIASITGHRTPSLLLNTYARTNEHRQRLALQSIAGNASVTNSYQDGP